MTENAKEEETKKVGKSAGTAKRAQSSTRKKTQTGAGDAKKAESTSTKKTQEKKAEECKKFVRLPKIDLSKFDVGTIFSGVDCLLKVARKLDSKATVLTKGLCDRMANYILKRMDASKKKK